MAATKHSGNTIIQIALERGEAGSRLMSRTRITRQPSRRRSCDASQPRSSAMPRGCAHHCRRRKAAIGTTRPAITVTTGAPRPMAASASSKIAVAGRLARSISAALDCGRCRDTIQSGPLWRTHSPQLGRSISKRSDNLAYHFAPCMPPISFNSGVSTSPRAGSLTNRSAT